MILTSGINVHTHKSIAAKSPLANPTCTGGSQANSAEQPQQKSASCVGKGGITSASCLASQVVCSLTGQQATLPTGRSAGWSASQLPLSLITKRPGYWSAFMPVCQLVDRFWPATSVVCPPANHQNIVFFCQSTRLANTLPTQW